MPDGEIAVVHQREEQIPAIVTGTRPCQALAHRYGIEDGVYLVAKRAGLRVETNLAEVVLLVFVMSGIVLLTAGHIVQGLAVGREDGRVLAPVLGLQQ